MEVTDAGHKDTRNATLTHLQIHRISQEDQTSYHDPSSGSRVFPFLRREHKPHATSHCSASSFKIYTLPELSQHLPFLTGNEQHPQSGLIGHQLNHGLHAIYTHTKTKMEYYVGLEMLLHLNCNPGQGTTFRGSNPFLCLSSPQNTP